jgi:hypothetical protein
MSRPRRLPTVLTPAEATALLGFPIAPEKFFAVWWQREQHADERLMYQHV